MTDTETLFRTHRYLKHFVALRPSARLLCEMYFVRAPDKILDMRPDTLAQILTWSNVQSGCNALVVDSCKGLLMGSVMERLGGQGTVLQVHQGNEPVRTVVEQMNFTVAEVEKVACSFSMNKLELFKELLQKEQQQETEGDVASNGDDCSSDQTTKSSQDFMLSCEDLLEQILGRNFKNDAPPAAPPPPHSDNTTNGDNNLNEDKEKPTIETSTSTTVVAVEDGKDTAPSQSTPTAPDAMDVEESKAIETTSTSVELKEGEKKDEEEKLLQHNQHRHDRKRKFEGGPPQQPKAPRVSFLSRERRRMECVRAMELMRAKKFDSLIVASKYHPKKVLLSLFEYLSDSCPFVVYCQYQEPLMECYVTLKDMKAAVNVELTETWCRNVQVLTDRSHPEIVMSATGGYLLRGIKVKP